MEFTERLTADVRVKEIADGRKVFIFSIVVNDNDKAKMRTEFIPVVNYFNSVHATTGEDLKF